SSRTPEPPGGRIDRLENNEPSGILREIPAYFPVFKLYKGPAPSKRAALYKKALEIAYAKGVTGVHSFDGPDALEFFDRLSSEGKLGLRVAYYPPAATASALRKAKIKFGYGNDYFRVSGVKLFSDGSLSSQTALCFDKYIGSKNNYGVETNPKEVIIKHIVDASKLGLPTAIHAIGDKAVSNVLDCYEKAPALLSGGRRRIEHLQMIRRSDIKRLKTLGIVASMQPSHCPSDITLIDKYWGKRGRNCFIFNTLLKQDIPLTFGSDVPIEVLDPIAGIDAAVNRKAPNSKKIFYPEEKISVPQAVYGFTAAPAHVVRREHELGALLPGYFADFAVLSGDIFKIPKTKIRNIGIMATFFDGKPVYLNKAANLSF
ncbi:MAG: amidohydrolase family protein, partial [Candidatus Zixiibacteriota bacterium]